MLRLFIQVTLYTLNLIILYRSLALIVVLILLIKLVYVTTVLQRMRALVAMI